MDCLFCKIIEGEVPSKKIHEDERAFAFLDIAPWQRGHALVIPKRHTVDALEDPATLAEIADAVVTVANLLKGRLGATAVNLLSNAGADSGQEVFHTHVHVIPRYPDNPGLGNLKSQVSEELDVTYQRLVKA
ncbi:MAG: HIT family protein [Propionibacterium sp.]|nr:HIT family protein [Propionibacterium sp.]